jgi:gluconate 2-dehydrogenase gamma chain
MPDDYLARRTLLRSSLLLVPGLAEALQHAHDSVQSSAARVEYLSVADASEIEALAGEIIPADDSPGAKEAGAIYFIDRALATFDRDKRDLYRQGITAAQAERNRQFPGSASIAALTSAQRIALLQAIEKTPFFDALRTHTIISFLAAPEWGGNLGKAGWKLIGFEDKWAFQPPFGYYDRSGNTQ